MPAQKLDEEAIFNIARKINAPDLRAEYLQQVCGDDAALRARVQALLQVHDQEKSFLTSPIPCTGRTIDEPETSAQPGTVIGPYKLLELIGEGGMGTVWMAQQTEPVQRVVALKLIKPGMDSKQVIA